MFVFRVTISSRRRFTVHIRRTTSGHSLDASRYHGYTQACYTQAYGPTQRGPPPHSRDFAAARSSGTGSHMSNL